MYQLRMGGLGLCDPSAIASFEFDSSLQVSYFIFNSRDLNIRPTLG